MEPRRTMTIDASVLDCAFCRKTLKPPTFKCDAGHMVCRDCVGGHLQVCSDAVKSISRCPDIDRVLRAAMVYCVHRDRGCMARVASHESADHLRSCNFVAPCKCPSVHCSFTASPSALPEHFSEFHGWHVVHNYVYGQAWKLSVPVPSVYAPSRAEVDVAAALVGESDGCLFVVYTSRLDRDAITVSVVCLSASEDAPAVASQFSWPLWLEEDGPWGKQRQLTTSRVTSCDGSRPPDRTPGVCLGNFWQPEVMIRIDKDGDEAGSSDVRMGDQATRLVRMGMSNLNLY